MAQRWPVRVFTRSAYSSAKSGCNAIECPIAPRYRRSPFRDRTPDVPGTHRRKIMKFVIYRFLAGVALVAGSAGQAAAADSKCSSVNIQVTNEYHDPVTGAKVDIKVVDFQYFDKEDNKWRSEVTDNQRINFGQTAVWNKNLEYVGGETGVKIKVLY